MPKPTVELAELEFHIKEDPCTNYIIPYNQENPLIYDTTVVYYRNEADDEYGVVYKHLKELKLPIYCTQCVQELYEGDGSYKDIITRTIDSIDDESGLPTNITPTQYSEGEIWSFPTYMNKHLMEGSSVCINPRCQDGWSYPSELEPYMLEGNKEKYKW